MDNFLNQQLYVFFTPINLYNYSVHKNIMIIKKLIVYGIFNFVLMTYVPE